MKKLFVVFSFIFLSFLVMPRVVNAEETLSASGTRYGDIYIDSTAPTGDNPLSTKKFSITKTNSAGYVYIKFTPVLNISSIEIMDSSAFEVVNKDVSTDGSVTVLLKTKDGKAINGTKTELLIAVGTLEGDVTEGCDFSYSLLEVKCLEIEGTYFDDKGNVVTEEEYNEACSNYTPTDPELPSDEENPPTGSVVPYVAIGGGLLAIVAVYLLSRKSNKMYKI